MTFIIVITHVVLRDMQLLQKTWMVELGLKDPPGTAWIAVMMAGGVAIGLMAGALTLLASLANAKHMELLVAILPKHVIEAVHRNAVVAESVPRVITLFTGSMRMYVCYAWLLRMAIHE